MSGQRHDTLDGIDRCDADIAATHVTVHRELGEKPHAGLIEKRGRRLATPTWRSCDGWSQSPIRVDKTDSG
jgi:hypothetical protein